MKKRLNVALKLACFETGKKQEQIAKLACIHPQTLSHAIHGRRTLKKSVRVKLAEVLGKPEAKLFPSEAAAS